MRLVYANVLVLIVCIIMQRPMLSFKRSSFVSCLYRCHSSKVLALKLNLKPDILVTSEEERLFKTLGKVVDDFKLNTTVRVAGGWVRDKLLGSTGKPDIDIALDNISGKEFSEFMSKWCRMYQKRRLNIGIIRKNPEKSKHLETATVHIDNLSVDFVNLRSEVYSSNSRIPEIQFGTPLEDASRRDFTVNSLFYNIHTKRVEDFTGLGFEDMKRRIIRTPLDAAVTLVDDPLRALRMIRFASRLNFSIDQELLLAASDPFIAESLTNKVSRERSGTEFMAMLNAEHFPSAAARAVALLNHCSLLPTIVQLPDTVVYDTPAHPKAANSLEKCDIPLLGLLGHDSSVPNPLSANTKKRIYSYGTLMCLCMSMFRTHASISIAGRNPLAKLFNKVENVNRTLAPEAIHRLAAITWLTKGTFCAVPGGKKSKRCSVTEWAYLHCLKLSNKDAHATEALQVSAMQFVELLEKVQTWLKDHDVADLKAQHNNEKGSYFGPLTRREIGLLLCDSSGAKVAYPDALLLALSYLFIQNGFASLPADLTTKCSHPGSSMINDFNTLLTPCTSECSDWSEMKDINTNVERMLMHGTDAALPDVDKISAGLVDSTGSSSGASLHPFALQHPIHGDLLQAVSIVVQAIDALALHGVWDVTRPLSGNDIRAMFPKLPSPTMIGDILSAQHEWTLKHPEGSVDNLKTELLSVYSMYV